MLLKQYILWKEIVYHGLVEDCGLTLVLTKPLGATKALIDIYKKSSIWNLIMNDYFRSIFLNGNLFLLSKFYSNLFYEVLALV